MWPSAQIEIDDVVVGSSSYPREGSGLGVETDADEMDDVCTY